MDVTRMTGMDFVSLSGLRAAARLEFVKIGKTNIGDDNVGQVGNSELEGYLGIVSVESL